MRISFAGPPGPPATPSPAPASGAIPVAEVATRAAQVPECTSRGARADRPTPAEAPARANDMADGGPAIMGREADIRDPGGDRWHCRCGE